MPLPDPERFARPLAALGWGLAVGGAVAGGSWWGVAAAGGVLMLLACVSLRDGFLLFGPITARELSLTARKRKPWVWRTLYTVATVAVLYLYLDSFTNLTVGPRAGVVNGWIAQTVAGGLFLFVGLLAVMECGGAIPDDRAAKRWEILRASDLRPREIIFGKWAGRLPTVLQPAFTIAPVLFAQAVLFGGVSPLFPLAVLAVCAAVALSLGGFALHLSVVTKRGLAVGRAIFLTVTYLVVGTLLACPTWPGGWGPWLSGQAWVQVLNAGNPLVVLMANGLPLDLPENQAADVLRQFVTFHVVIGLTFLLLAVRRVGHAGPEVRSAKKKERRHAPASAPGRAVRSTVAVPRPPVGAMPIVWWARYGWLNRLQAAVVRTWSGPRGVLYLTAVHIPFWLLTLAEAGRVSNVWAELWRIYGNVVVIALVVCGCLFGIPALFRGAWCVARERAADTHEPLLLTALTPLDIAFQKWLGVLLCEWPLFLFMLTVGGFAAVSGGLSAVGVGLFVGGVLVMAGGLTAVGLAISVRVKSPRRAVGFAVTLLVLTVCVTNLHAIYSDGGDGFALACRVCPPVASAPWLDGTAANPGTMKRYPLGLPTIFRHWVEGVAGWTLVGGLAFWTAWGKLRSERAN